MSSAPAATRRSQAERREATRSALLDATIASLVEDGWAGTTTRSVAERARVSQGAQQHHFPTKNSLVEAAIDRLLQQLAAAALADVPPVYAERERAEALLDRLWEIHTLPINRAIQELLAAARTDPAITARVAQMVGSATDLTRAVAAHVLPTLSEAAGFDEWLLMALAAMRGTVAVMIPGAESSTLDWQALRGLMLRRLDELANAPG